MAAFGVFSRKFLLNTTRGEARLRKCQILRMLSYTPKEYGDSPNPAPVFIKNEVQSLLKTLTRVDLARVYRKRKLGTPRLEQPVYKFMTDQQLEEAYSEVRRQVDKIIQMPPVVPVRKPIDTVISDDPELQGLETSNLVFTDITFGVSNRDRLIVVREPNGALKEADWEMRDRLNQFYFPAKFKSLHVPKMFDDRHLESLLNRNEFEFILDRACLQFEPDDETYQKIVSVTYQAVNEKNAFDTLRSTRHFGSFAFFLAWHKMIDNLLIDLMEHSQVEEINCLIELYSQIHKVKFNSDGELKALEEYIKNESVKKASLELTCQALKNALNEKKELEKGIREAHGYS